MRLLVTGAAGFIGYHVSAAFAAEGCPVVGLDNLNDYYDPSLKKTRLRELERYPSFRFERMDLADGPAVLRLFEREGFTHVVNLAAQAGVRYSLDNPASYAQSNLVGFLSVLEGCRHTAIQHLVYASSSSVYGLNTSVPFSVSDSVDHPVSLYAASKKANELMAHTYSHLFRLPTTGLRFFTVYGPWGRPDMALYKFTKAILADEPIPVFNHGKMQRDFTYIDDITEGVRRVVHKIPAPSPQWDPAHPDPAASSAPYALYNIGNNAPVALETFIQVLEECLGKKAQWNLLPMQPGDVVSTCADISALREAVGFAPSTEIRTGIAHFVEWYKSYHAL